jgi:Protein of unknown function (DUF2510)
MSIPKRVFWIVAAFWGLFNFLRMYPLDACTLGLRDDLATSQDDWGPIPLGGRAQIPGGNKCVGLTEEWILASILALGGFGLLALIYVFFLRGSAGLKQGVPASYPTSAHEVGAAWLPDPDQPERLRYWDGTR